MSEISPETIRALQIRFPIANVERELLLYNLWLQKNPARRPVLLLRGVENWLKKSSPKAALVSVGKWWETEQGTLDMAGKVGVKPSPRDSWPELRAKIREKLG